MAHQQTISELLSILYQERTLIAHLFEKRNEKRLFQKSEILMLCRKNKDRLERLVKADLLKIRGGKFELNQSLYQAFSHVLKQPDSRSHFAYLVLDLKQAVSHIKDKKYANKSTLLLNLKGIFRSLEESYIHELEQVQCLFNESSLKKLRDESLNLQSYLWKEKELQIYRDDELDVLMQDFNNLLKEGLNSLENLRAHLALTELGPFTFSPQVMQVKEYLDKGNLLENSNLKEVLVKFSSVFLENSQTFSPKIPPLQLKNKSSLHFLAAFQKKNRKTN